MDSRLDSPFRVLQVALGLTATLAGLDKFFNILTDWGAYRQPVPSQPLCRLSVATFMAIVGVVEIAVGVDDSGAAPRIGAYVGERLALARRREPRARRLLRCGRPRRRDVAGSIHRWRAPSKCGAPHTRLPIDETIRAHVRPDRVRLDRPLQRSWHNEETRLVVSDRRSSALRRGRGSPWRRTSPTR